MKRRYKLLDEQTGKTIPGVVVQQRQKTANRGFAMLQENKQTQFSEDPSVTKAELRLYCFLQTKLDYKNHIDWTQTQLAKHLKMYQPEVNKAINKLVAKGILKKVAHPHGRYFTYWMNPEYTHKGNQHARKDTRQTDSE